MTLVSNYYPVGANYFQGVQPQQQAINTPAKPAKGKSKMNTAMKVGLGAVALAAVAIAGIAIHNKSATNKIFHKGIAELTNKNGHRYVDVINKETIRDAAQSLVDFKDIKKYDFYAKNLTAKEYNRFYETGKIAVEMRAGGKAMDTAKTAIIAFDKECNPINAVLLKGTSFSDDIAKLGNELFQLSQ